MELFTSRKFVQVLNAAPNAPRLTAGLKIYVQISNEIILKLCSISVNKLLFWREENADNSQKVAQRYYTLHVLTNTHYF